MSKKNEVKTRDVVSRSLCLGEPAFGTKAYDERYMQGLVQWLQLNNTVDIDDVVIVGGLLPRIPAWYSVTGSEAMRFLGNDLDKPESEDLEDLLDRAQLSKSDEQYFRKYVDRKILTMNDALTYSHRQLATLAAALSDNVQWHYQHGEEDAANIKQVKELMITNAARKRTNKKEYETKLTKLQDTLAQLEAEQEELQTHRQAFLYVNRRVNLLAGQDDAKSYLHNIGHDVLEKFQVPEDSVLREEIHSLLLSKKATVAKAKQHYSRFQKSYEAHATHLKSTQSDIKDLERKIDSVNRELEAWGFFSVTKRVETRPDEEEIFFRLAKREYNDRIYATFEALTGRLHVHTSARKKISPQTKNGDSLSYVLMHNPNHLYSSTPTQKDVTEMTREGRRLAQLEELLDVDIPDAIFAAHGKYGFRVKPQLKHREDIAPGHYVDDSELSVYVKLPTFQSGKNLQVLIEKGLKNEHTKRYLAGHASGAIIYTTYDDGSIDVELIPEQDLLLYATSSEDASALSLDLQQIELDGDAHIGSANILGRPSCYDVIDAAQAYQRDHGLPNILVISEVLNAPIKGVVDSNQQYWGILPSEFEQLISREMERTDISSEEKLAHVARLAVMNAQAIPITHTDLIVKEWRNRCLPYVVDVLEEGGEVYIVGGNHYAKSGMGREEGIILSSCIPPQYDAQVHVANGIGETQGIGEFILKDGKRMYTAHRLRSGKDELLPAMKQIQGAGIVADIVLCFDRHHPMGGYVNDTTYALSPGKQGWNPYVDEIGKVSSPRGVMNLHVSDTPAGGPSQKYSRWSFVLNPTLETQYMSHIKKDLPFT